MRPGVLEMIQANLDDRKLTIGDLRFIDLGRTAVRVEFGEPNITDGDMTACVIPREIVTAVCRVTDADRRRIAEWFGIPAAPAGKVCEEKAWQLDATARQDFQ